MTFGRFYLSGVRHGWICVQHRTSYAPRSQGGKIIKHQLPPKARPCCRRPARAKSIPRPYQALIDQYALGKPGGRDQAQASINAQGPQLARTANWGDKGWATANNLIETPEGAVPSWQAAPIKGRPPGAIDAAKGATQLQTRLTSPIFDELVGIRQIDVGQTSSSPSTTNGASSWFTQLDPISLIFTLAGDKSAAKSSSNSKKPTPPLGFSAYKPGRLRPCWIRAWLGLVQQRDPADHRPSIQLKAKFSQQVRAGSGRANSSMRGLLVDTRP